MSIDSIPYLTSFNAHSVWGKYKFDVEFTDGINFISGLNGSGKSTLVKMIYVQLVASLKSGLITSFTALHSYSNNTSYLYSYYPKASSAARDYINNTLLDEKYSQKQNEKLFPKELFSSGLFSPKTSLYCQKVNLEPGSYIQESALVWNGIQIFQTINEANIGGGISSIKVPSVSVYSPKFYDVINNIDMEEENRRNRQTQDSIYLKKLVASFQSYEYHLLEQFFENPSLDKNEILKERNKFESLLNDFFHEVGKELVRNNDKKLAFKILSTEEIIEVDTLSHGEQSLLYMLLLVFLHRDSVRIFLFDEPETALHLTWQRELPEAFEKLAPNSQFIITTHSPGIVHGKWLAKMQDMKDIRSMMDVE